jgi:hypothetical protein
VIGSARSRVVQGLVRHLLRPLAGGGRQARAPLPSGRRILLLHLDGVGRAQLELAMERGYAPTLRGLVEKGPYRVSKCRAGAPTSSMQHEPQFLFHRVLTECMFAEFAANSCVIDIARGTPIVYACFIGYDEYAHRRGPFSRMALLKLWELDRMLGA